jgi:predicted metal-dependent hydrolase
MDENIGLSLGIEQFNRQDFYGCHDTLEAVWLQANPTDKNFYQGILQIAVAHYHLANHNWRGAVTLLGEGIRRLKSFRPDYREVDIESLFQSSVSLLENLQTVTPENLPEWLEIAPTEQLTPQIAIKSK